MDAHLWLFSRLARIMLVWKMNIISQASVTLRPLICPAMAHKKAGIQREGNVIKALATVITPG